VCTKIMEDSYMHLECPLIFWGQGLEVGEKLVYCSKPKSSRNRVFSNLRGLRVLQSVCQNYGRLLWACRGSSNSLGPSFGGRLVYCSKPRSSRNRVFSNLIGPRVLQSVYQNYGRLLYASRVSSNFLGPRFGGR
jgi:hypothetical protein